MYCAHEDTETLQNTPRSPSKLIRGGTRNHICLTLVYYASIRMRILRNKTQGNAESQKRQTE